MVHREEAADLFEKTEGEAISVRAAAVDSDLGKCACDAYVPRTHTHARKSTFEQRGAFWSRG